MGYSSERVLQKSLFSRDSLWHHQGNWTSRNVWDILLELTKCGITALDFGFVVCWFGVFLSKGQQNDVFFIPTYLFTFAKICMRNVMKWHCAASSSADVEISSSSWKQLLDNIVSTFTITKTCGIHNIILTNIYSIPLCVVNPQPYLFPCTLWSYVPACL